MEPASPLRRTVVVANPSGLHMRPAVAFVQKANQYNIEVTIQNGTNRANGKSPMELMLLMALPGSTLIIEVVGPDATKALEPLCETLSDPGEPG